MTSPTRYGPPRGARVAVLAIAVFGFTIALREINDPDYWTHLALGRAYVAARSVSIPEPFLVGPDISAGPLAAPEWPFQVGLYAWRTVAGDEGVSIAVAAAVALIALLAALPLRHIGSAPALALGVVFLGCVLHVARFRFAPRPELGTYLLLGCALLLARRFTVRPAWQPLVLLGATLVVWRSMHVSWTIGAVFAGLVLVARPNLEFWRRQRRWVLAGAALVAAAVLAEAGRFALGVLGSLGRGEVFEGVIEMRPTHEFPLVAWPFGVLAALGGTLAWNGRAERYGRLLLVLAATVLGFLVVRNVAFAALVIGFAAVEGLASQPEVVRAQAVRRGAPWAAAMALAALVALAARDRDPPIGLGIDWRWFPRDAAEWVRSRDLPGPVFNSWTLGGYLDFAWGGRPATFLDGRLGGGDRLALHDAIEVAASAEPALARGGFGTLVVAPLYGNSAMLVEAVPWLLGRPEWRLVRATDALVFVREPLPAGVTPLDPSEAWRAILRATEPLADQVFLGVEHLSFTRAIAHLWLGDEASARREYEAGRRRHPRVAVQYRILERLLRMSSPPGGRAGAT